MKPSPRKYAFIGALITLAGCIAYLKFGPVDIFGIPEARWAYNLFLPGIWAGKQAYQRFSLDQHVCQAIGVLVMVLIGAVLGWLIGWALRAVKSGK